MAVLHALIGRLLLGFLCDASWLVNHVQTMDSLHLAVSMEYQLVAIRHTFPLRILNNLVLALSNLIILINSSLKLILVGGHRVYTLLVL